MKETTLVPGQVINIYRHFAFQNGTCYVGRPYVKNMIRLKTRYNGFVWAYKEDLKCIGRFIVKQVK